MDNDMLMLDDIAKLWDLRDDRYAVQFVKHNHVPKEDVKFLDCKQTKYAKKNWPSVMLTNCARCTALTPNFVNSAMGLELHRLKWLGDDGLIGEIPHSWNHLAGYDEPGSDASPVHFTIDGPDFQEYWDCEFADEWMRERDAMLYVARRSA
jgi:hypothetical protein